MAASDEQNVFLEERISPWEALTKARELEPERDRLVAWRKRRRTQGNLVPAQPPAKLCWNSMQCGRSPKEQARCVICVSLTTSQR